MILGAAKSMGLSYFVNLKTKNSKQKKKNLSNQEMGTLEQWMDRNQILIAIEQL